MLNGCFKREANSGLGAFYGNYSSSSNSSTRSARGSLSTVDDFFYEPELLLAFYLNIVIGLKNLNLSI